MYISRFTVVLVEVPQPLYFEFSFKLHQYCASKNELKYRDVKKRLFRPKFHFQWELRGQVSLPLHYEENKTQNCQKEVACFGRKTARESQMFYFRRIHNVRICHAISVYDLRLCHQLLLFETEFLLNVLISLELNL